MKKLHEELFGGWSVKEQIYAWTLISLQVVFYVIYPDSFWGFVAGMTGTICVLLVAKGKISNYFFGFIQTGVTMVLGFQAFLIGETMENVFYFVSQFLGIKEWKNNLNENTHIVKTRKFTIGQWMFTIWSVAALTALLGYTFKHFNGTQPFIDAFTLVLALVAQILMVYRFREQWLLWAVLNIVSIYQWITLNNMSLVAMYLAFLINTIYGYVNWSNQQKEIPAAAA